MTAAAARPPVEVEPLLRMDGIVKRFAGATALDGVDFALRRGEVHALVGENGAGKSTLIKIMTGAYRRDGGRMWLEERPVSFASPADAQDAGVIAVHQEIHLLAFRTVAENVWLGREPRRWGFVDWGRMMADTEALLERLALAIDPAARLGALSTAQQQMVAIARGVSLGAKVLVLDEPTSSLAEREVAILYDLIRQLQAQGTAVVYISHRFDELYAVCDRVTVLRDGKLVGTHRLADIDRLDLVCLMLGKPREALRQGTTAFAGFTPEADDATPLLRAEGLRRGQKLRGVSLAVRKGEILGLAGLLGSGRTETARALFGADPADEGTVQLDGRRLDPRTPDDAIAAGIAFVSEDRKGEGLRRGQKLRGVSLAVRKGEILGLAGLLGSGRTETARALFGADPADEGTVQLDGQRLDPRTPDDAIAAGIAFVSEDRKGEGIIPELSVRENLTLAALPTLTRLGVVDGARQRAIVDRFMQRLGIKATSADQKIRELSGGNQQKVLLARWLCMQPALLILDEPTRGIDIGAKGEIQALINELASSGLGVLMISSELEELVEGSSRVVVLRDGQDVAELRGAEISQRSIIHAMAEGSATAAPTPAEG